MRMAPVTEAPLASNRTRPGDEGSYIVKVRRHKKSGAGGGRRSMARSSIAIEKSTCARRLGEYPSRVSILFESIRAHIAEKSRDSRCWHGELNIVAPAYRAYIRRMKVK